MSRRDRIAQKIAERSHYEDRGYRDPETGEVSLCRIWDGPTSGSKDHTRGHGYGRMNLDGATVAVHIASWVNENGLIPPRKQLDHLCHQRDCCEERHLRLRTHKQNQRNKKPKVTTARWGSGVSFEGASHDAQIEEGTYVAGTRSFMPEYATGPFRRDVPDAIAINSDGTRVAINFMSPPKPAPEVTDE